MTVRFAVADADELARDDRLWELYDEAFPANEREPREVIVGAVRAGVALMVRARTDDDEQTVGLASVHLLVDPAALFLVYLAIAAPLRGQRLGGALLDQAYATAAARSRSNGRSPIAMIWEVDPPSLASGSEALRRARRIEFFRRAGGQLLPRAYAQPPLSGGPPVPMQLMARADPASVLDAATVERLVRAVYFEKYGAANGIADETLRSLLRPTP